MAYHKTGVLLLAFGGPETLDDVEPFMQRLTGKKPSPEVLERVKDRYRQIGGGSPLPEMTRRQAEALENDLGSDDFEAFVGMRYSAPLIADTVEAMAVHGIEKAVALSLSPHSSRVSSGAYIEEVRRATAKIDCAPEFDFVTDWHVEPGYLDAIADNTKAALARLDPGSTDNLEVVFSAHSLPKSYIDDGDPYVDQLNETVAGVVSRLGDVSWTVAYQSKGQAPGEWLGPEVDGVLEDLARKGTSKILVVPICFVSDHVETLYDIDIAIRNKAASLGLTFERAASLNTSPKFIDALTRVVRERLRVE